MLNPSPSRWISQYFFGFFFSYGVYLPFWALWFEGQGVSATNIGFLMGIGFATRCVANMLITPRIHKVEYLMPALRWLSLAALVFIGFHFFTSHNVWLMAVATILFNLSCGPIMPLSDSVANYYNRLQLLDYGRTRLWGSIAFIAGSTVVGFLIAHYGLNMIIYTAMAGMLAAHVLALRSPSVALVSDTSSAQERPKLLQLLKDPSVVRFLVLITLIQSSHAAYYGFSTIYWKEAGYSEDIIGYLWSLGVIAEVGVFAFTRRLFGGWTLRSLFLIAAAAVMLRWGITASTTAIFALVIVQLLHGVTFALAHFATIKYIQQQGDNKMVALQSLYNAIPLGACMALMMAVSGWGYGQWGGNVFWLMAAMGAVALFIKPQGAEVRV
ncbi:3-phenylpropionic acid transporter [Vibrio sp. 10N.286.49.B3]|uniref:3-phenylpropionate MFS transporter n=1 Tax=Vibrio sp. 10N.286.49.B3 TaxID=1880855 RepID=UPI000C862004|nr:3-phenylpropionate MFS transporter [Vibrio sp. 10N.286.49.B3]PMH46237.1 3-phenylpropionic acid transporter [Vibrio sp. 10N.286.49.B3]